MLAAIHIIEWGDAKCFGDLAKDLMHQAHLGQDLHLPSSAGAVELMVCRSGRYKSLGQRKVQRGGCGGHNGGRGNGDRGNSPRNSRVSLAQKGESNRNPITGIDRTTIDAE